MSDVNYDEEETLINPLLPNLPLFGFENKKIGLAIFIGLPSVFIFSTIVSAFVHYHSAADIFFTLSILMTYTSHLFIIRWYKQGGLDPKFIILIYWNMLSIIFLSICVLIFHSRV